MIRELVGDYISCIKSSTDFFLSPNLEVIHELAVLRSFHSYVNSAFEIEAEPTYLFIFHLLRLFSLRVFSGSMPRLPNLNTL